VMAARHAEDRPANDDRRKLGDIRNPAVSVLQNAKAHNAVPERYKRSRSVMRVCKKAACLGLSATRASLAGRSWCQS
jgi:hypothetical protein